MEPIIPAPIPSEPMEPLESRCFLSATAHPRSHADTAVHSAVHAAASRPSGPAIADTDFLTVQDVRTILAQAASQARPGQVIAVSDRDGHILGIVEMSGIGLDPTSVMLRGLRTTKAIDSAVTAAFFQSTQEAFTTRTARFIIQDHFPHPVRNTPGGPLYGVEFSSQPGSDVFGKTALAISGDPGGIPLYKGGVPVGGIGVAGDGVDLPAREDLRIAGDPDAVAGRAFNGHEEQDFDENVALAGAAGFMAPKQIRADRIFLEGLRFPFTAGRPARGNPARTLDELESGDFGHVVSFGTFFNGNVAAGHAEFPATTFAGVTGEIRNAFQAGMDADPAIPSLTVAEVQTIIANAVQQALVTRAAIREPIGVAARVHVAVVDTQGNILGTFRMQDGTNFSYDVAVQKARTANFFSSNTAAFSTRSVGFLAQRFFPPGINRTGPGPLYHLQNELSGLPSLSPTLSQIQLPQKYLSSMKIRNGITIFPGGFPLYKNGVLVGAIGISGDGVDQDDLIGYAGTNGFRPSPDIRIDHLGDDAIKSQILDTLPELQALGVQSDVINFITTRSNAGFLHVRMPYVKFPRNPNV